jgi:hypothetical protein
MKTFLRVAAVLSFGLCFAGGFLIFCVAALHWDTSSDAAPIAVGLVLMGMAVFAGSMIWWAAEKCCTRYDGKCGRNPDLPI